jgi:hypothetical protein
MNQLFDTRPMRILQKPVFVDWRGVRRRLMVTTGVAVAVALTAWLSLIVVSVVVVVVPFGAR